MLVSRLVSICRNLVGSLFIISGLIKANDALGFAYKLEEYFEPGALNMSGWTEYALALAVVICIGEILLGVALVVGALPRLTASLTVVMMAFFTWLTWYTAHCDEHGVRMVLDAAGASVEIANQCVLACGCFGNAIPLTPMESFWKDVVLSALSLPVIWAAFKERFKLNEGRESMLMMVGSLVVIYLFSTLMLDWHFPVLFAALAYLVVAGIGRRSHHPQRQWFMALGVVVLSGLFQYTTLSHLPFKDYRPYAEGQSIIENRMSADERGLEGPVSVTAYVFKNIQTGADTSVMSSDWLNIYASPWFKETYELVTYDGEEIRISEGYEPLILDLQFIDEEGSDWTDDVLAYEGNTLIHVSKDLGESELSAQSKLNDLAESAIEAGWRFVGLTNVSSAENAAFSAAHGANYPFYTSDEIELKIIVRSNPGLVWIRDGRVVQKWAWRDIPDFQDLE
jgi:uncharacterized membrane protein YphA (DoxX/SURF4 family)